LLVIVATPIESLLTTAKANNFAKFIAERRGANKMQAFRLAA